MMNGFIKQLVCLVLLLLSVGIAKAQPFAPEWYILEKGSSISIIKPGVNDLTLFLAQSAGKPIDKAAVDAMTDRITFGAGSVVLVYAKENDSYIATDMEGRNLLIKGNITRAVRGANSGVAYLKSDLVTPAGTIRKMSYVWMKERKEGAANVTIQCDGNQTAEVALNKIYDINQTTLEMAGSVKQKTVE